ncbi:nuclease-related domain-containing protein [Bacillus coreaensis]
MIIKQRTVPKELLILRYLDKRMKLLEVARLEKLEKGYAGELQWDYLMTNGLSSPNYLMMNDLLFTNSGGHTFQIDSLLLKKKFIIFEVKNFDGEYFLENNRWYTIKKTEIQNPLIQLQRTETAFRRLLKDLGINIPVEAYLVFVNPEFTLFYAPIHSSMLLPSQINRFIQNTNRDVYSITAHDEALAERIVSCHLDKNPFERLPNYSYQELIKGIPCSYCGMFLFPCSQSYIYCKSCGNRQLVEEAILRSLVEFQKLFPDKLLTTNGVFDWCGGVVSEKSVRRILKKQYISQSSQRYTYFI